MRRIDGEKRSDYPSYAVIETQRMRQDNPTAKAIDMARDIGVSRERVRQILTSLSLPTSFRRHWFCKDCGKRVASYAIRCRECYTKSRYTYYTCEECGSIKRIRISDLKRLHPRFCSRKCQGKWFGRTYGRGHHADAYYFSLEVNSSSAAPPITTGSTQLGVPPLGEGVGVTGEGGVDVATISSTV